ncbi:MAG: ABC-ATPase UvrA [Planctomyces sp.]
MLSEFSDSVGGVAGPLSAGSVRWLRIRGARTHNLQNVDADLPIGRLTVVTGVSGSGKSSLVFDTLFAESQRRYLECISIRTRSLLQQLPRADVDEITGLAPAISVDQRVATAPVRSTLAVVTEIHDYLRLLYARAGTVHCTGCGRPVRQQSVDQIVSQVLELSERTRLMVLAPMVRQRRGAHAEVLERIVRNGFVRVRIDGQLLDVTEAAPLSPGRQHSIEAVVDRIVIKEGVAGRLRESIELACRESEGTCLISYESAGEWRETFYSTRFVCPDCSLSFPTPEPASLSHFSARGACVECRGLGTAVSEDDESTLMLQAAVCGGCGGERLNPVSRGIQFLGTTLPQFCRLSVVQALALVEGWVERLLSGGESVSREGRLVAERTLPELQSRLRCLEEIGVGYLTLDRPARTLSGGEYQRARLASSLSAGVHGAHYVLDEPTAGLHPRDTQRLLSALYRLRDQGCTVIVVEHDAEVMLAADWLLDIGPGAGGDGGRLLFAGTPADCRTLAETPTGHFLRTRAEQIGGTATGGGVAGAGAVQPGERGWLRIEGACLNNLQSVTAELPLGCLTVVSGVSGSGKSSLVRGTLAPFLAAVVGQEGLSGEQQRQAAERVRCAGVSGWQSLQRMVAIDQSPPGRSARSCLATLGPIWTEIRRLYAKTREARARGLGAQFFSFNAGGGRCGECLGLGSRSVRTAFFPQAAVVCAACRGTRFGGLANSIRFRGHSVAEVLQMRVDEARGLFSEFPVLSAALSTYCDVGLGYLQLGQPTSTYSGGENQRARLATELTGAGGPATLFVLDEPTSGMHPLDVAMLMRHLRGLCGRGHSVVVIEHNLEVLRGADWVLDLGPDAASEGGRLMFSGVPAELLERSGSVTAASLRGYGLGVRG